MHVSSLAAEHILHEDCGMPSEYAQLLDVVTSLDDEPVPSEYEYAQVLDAEASLDDHGVDVVTSLDDEPGADEGG